MAAVALKAYVRANPPADAASTPRYIDNELKKLQTTIATLEAAIQQLQAKVNP